jgi:hypothetical protein
MARNSYLTKIRDENRANIREYLYIGGYKYKFEHEFEGRHTWKRYPSVFGFYAEITRLPCGNWLWYVCKGKRITYSARIEGKKYKTPEFAHIRINQIINQCLGTKQLPEE